MPQRSDALTYVELTWLEKRIEHWVRFGRIAKEPVLNRRVRIGSFAQGSAFAFVRCASNDFGKIISRIDVLHAVAPASPIPPCLCPSRRRILLRVPGWPNVSRVLRAVDQVEAIGVDPANPAPDHWRHVQNRLSAGEEWRPYTTARHSAPLLRRSDAR
jgi:hypothetical protein